MSRDKAHVARQLIEANRSYDLEANIETVVTLAQSNCEWTSLLAAFEPGTTAAVTPRSLLQRPGRLVGGTTRSRIPHGAGAGRKPSGYERALGAVVDAGIR